MRIRLHHNGWTPLIDNYDIKTATAKDIKTITQLLYTNTVVVFTNQELTPDDELNFCKTFGVTESYKGSPTVILSEHYHDVVRVTGNKNNLGAFPNPDELEWHLNKSANPNKKNIVYLYGVQGTAGSRTSWINTILAYQDLHPVVKKDISTAHIKLLSPGDFWEQLNENVHKKSINFEEMLDSGNGTVIAEQSMPLVHTNPLGVRGLYWPSRMIYSIEEEPGSRKSPWSKSRSKEMIELLHEHVFQEKYMYHHDWNDGDLVLSEQFLGVHKRWAFPGIERRLLHRIEFDTSKVNLC